MNDCPNCHCIEPSDYMSVWEGMLELRRDRGEHAMNKLWDRVGTVAMRDIAARVTREAVASFQDLPTDDQDGFDWEFVPVFLATVKWAEYV